MDHASHALYLIVLLVSLNILIDALIVKKDTQRMIRFNVRIV